MGARGFGEMAHHTSPSPVTLGERVGRNPGRPTTESRLGGCFANASRCRVGSRVLQFQPKEPMK